MNVKILLFALLSLTMITTTSNVYALEVYMSQDTISLTINPIPENISSIRVSHGGISGEYWEGWYGPVMRNIELTHTVQIPN